jgi:hypothetical protein
MLVMSALLLFFAVKPLLTKKKDWRDQLDAVKE